MLSIAFLLTTLIIVATPGTGVLYTLSAGLARGARASIVAAVGCTLGIVPPMVAAITGLAALLNASSVAFQTLKYRGVVYLLYMAWNTWRDKNALVMDEVGHVCGVCGLRRVRRLGSEPRHCPPAGHDLDAPCLCGFVCRARR
jgi:threonine/homoserine/homoserine lactone efflux protein